MAAAVGRGRGGEVVRAQVVGLHHSAMQQRT